MLYKKITIETTTNLEDIISSIIFNCGIVGVQIEDNVPLNIEEEKEQFIDIPLVLKDDGSAKIIFYVHIIENEEDQDFYNNKVDEYNKIINNKNNVDLSYIESIDNYFLTDEFNKIIDEIKDSIDIIDVNDDNNSSFNIIIENIDDIDYIANLKKNAHIIEVDNIIIKPPYKEIESIENKLIINIEPGMAFGTGDHDTTKLCIQSIIKYKNENNSILDLGCGSGILGIIANKLGYKNITNIDIDKNIINNIIDNTKYNGINLSKEDIINTFDFKENTKTVSNLINSDFSLIIGNVLENANLSYELMQKKYDIVVANILAPVIISLISELDVSKFINNNGLFICSGIIKDKKNDVLLALSNNKTFKLLEITEINDWVCIVSQKIP